MAAIHKHAIRGILWIAAYLLLVLLPPGVLLLGKMPPGTTFGWDFAIALGFAALAIMFSMFLLTARLKWITHAFGIDIIYYFHTARMPSTTTASPVISI